MHEEHAYLVLDDGGVAISRCHFDSEASRTRVVLFVAKGLLQVLSRLHAAQHFHGDINPQNVLLRSDIRKKLQAVNLVDFAMCRSQQKLNRGLAQMAHWTPPPEYFKKAPLLGSALDIWHVAVLLLQTLKGETLDYGQADVLAEKPRAEALAMQHPMGLVLASALVSEPGDRPDALSLWRALRSCK